MKKLFWMLLTVCLLPAAAMASSDEMPAVTIAHRMMMLMVQLGVILFVAKLGNIFFERIHLPGTLGELAGGMLIGPFALGMLPFYGFAHGLFPIFENSVISPELSGICALAAVVLLFVVGLETDISLLMRYSVAGALVGLGGVVVSFIFGSGAVMLFSRTAWGYELFGGSLGFFSPACMLMGTVATATSVGITARILSEKQKLRSPEGVTILSAAVIDDVLGIIVLAVVMGVVTATQAGGGVHWGHIGVIASKAVGVWLAATAIGLLASRKISFLLKWFRHRTSIAIMALGLAMILAGLFEEAGLAMIIGAYVMGLTLSKTDISHVVREKLQSVYELLIPVFFCVMGMRINLAAIGSSSVLMLGLLYAFAAMAAKVLGSGLPAMLANFNLRGALRIGFGMTPRCEVALIIAGIGLATRVGPSGKAMLSHELFAAVIMMVVINTIIAPPALVMLFRSDRSGIRKAVAVRGADRAVVSFEFPSHEMTAYVMGKLTEVFESEGFFVHVLSYERQLHQLRKDRTVIDLQSKGSEIIFECDRADAPLVNTAMVEALAVMEQTIRGLKKPMDTRSIGTRIQQDAPPGRQQLSLGQYISPALIVPDLKGATKAEIIDELLEVLRRNGLLTEVKPAREAVWAREQSMSTGLQYGVAIPHGKTDTVNRLICSVGVSHQGVDFNAMDHEPSTIFFLTLSPKNRPAPHVQFMSTISQVLNSRGRERILACTTAQEIYDVLSSSARKERVAPVAPVASKMPPSVFRLADYLNPEVLQPDLHGRTREEVIDELLALLGACGRVADVEEARAAVLTREDQMSTGMADGVAIPHGRTDAVNELVCAVGVSRAGVNFGASDAKPAQIIVLALTPTEGSDPYLQFAAAIIGALDAPGRRKVLSARTPEELNDALIIPATRS